MAPSRRINVLTDLIAKSLPEGSKVLDIGCGDGKIDSLIKELKPSVLIEGIDVLLRDRSFIKVTKFDGNRIPFDDDHFDFTLLIDVLHHTDDPSIILKEAKRVSKKHVLIKDHAREGFLAEATLRFMDYVGNARHGVYLPYHYLDNSEWEVLFKKTELTVAQRKDILNLYPFPAGLLFDRKLHFFAALDCHKGR